MEPEFRVLRCKIARSLPVGDGLVELPDRGKRPAGMAMEFDPVRAQLGEAAIGAGGFGVTPAIAEYPGANAQHRRVAAGPRQSAPNAFDGVVAPVLVQQR